MKPLSLVPLAAALLATASRAAEITIEARPFTLEKSLSAAVLPGEGVVAVGVEPKAWADFKIVEIAAHGAKVAKGGVLVRFDAEGFDRKLVDARRSLETSRLNLAQAERDLKQLKETSEHKLEAFRRAAEIAREENEYFTKTRRKVSEESAAEQLDGRRHFLDNQREELKQLAEMYKADDLTENTEEIILTRQKNAVQNAEFQLKVAELDYKRTMEVSLPRETVSLANAERDSALALDKAREDIPRALALKELELASTKTAFERETQNLAELEADRKLMEIKAPTEGVFLHGVIENGRWSTGEGVKALVKNGRPLPNKPFAAFVPSGAKLQLHAFADEGGARALKKDLAGVATLAGREDSDIPVKVAEVASTPSVDGSFPVVLTADWPKDVQVVPGGAASVRVIAYHQDKAIAVPTRAIRYGADGWTVEVKLADGKTERRKIQRGRVSGEMTEIRSGLEAGQVIIAPDKA